MAETADCVVIGAGVVGLAVARELALAGRDVIILEAADSIGTETSSRNSEVIHAGIYYPTGTLKAKLCVAGRDFLYRYCAERGIEHRRCGKLIVATSEDQLPYLKKLHDQAQANGVADLQPIGGNAARMMEPNLRCHAALLSPSTGIIDSHSLMLAYQGDAEARGAVIAFNSKVVSGRVGEDGIELDVTSTAADPDEPALRLRCRSVVNSAGLHAQAVARTLAGLKPDTVPPTYYAKGNYFQLVGAAPFKHLVYPVPEKAGLGVHITIDLGGQARFGPDVEWIDELNYDVDPTRCAGFYAEIRKYWPALPDGALVPGYAGVRPKVGPSGAVGTDFMIHGPETHGVPGLVNLFGIESPGLTASHAVATEVAARLAA